MASDATNSEQTVSQYQPIADLLNNPTRRQSLIGDCVLLIESQVSQKTGLYGIAVKTAFAAIQRLSPRIIYKAMDALIDDLATCLEPFIRKDPSHIVATFTAERNEICTRLLEVSDNRVNGVDIDLIQSIYRKLRPKADKHIIPTIPDIGIMIQHHLSKTTISE